MAVFLSVLLMLLAAVSSHGEEESCNYAEVLVMIKEEMKKGLQEAMATIIQNHSNCSSSNIPSLDLNDVLKAVAKIEKRLGNKMDDFTLSIEEKLSKVALNGIEPVLARLYALHKPGKFPSHPALSCAEIYAYDNSTPSGSYWIQAADGNAARMFCDMNITCGGQEGGWMKVGSLDMRSSGSQCPSGLRERVHPGHRLCGLNIDGGGCSQVFFETKNVRYDRVCGRVVAYQVGSPDSFGLYPPELVGTRTIDQVYLDGISLTYSNNPRKHIWSFAAATDEYVVSTTLPSNNCPCINILRAAGATPPPDFVGNDYFCDTGSTEPFKFGKLYSDNPLWDGAGCGPANTCCSLNNPPWFFKQLQSSTSEDIEMRVCCNQDRSDEDLQIEQIEIYVH